MYSTNSIQNNSSVSSTCWNDEDQKLSKLNNKINDIPDCWDDDENDENDEQNEPTQFCDDEWLQDEEQQDYVPPEEIKNKSVCSSLNVNSLIKPIQMKEKEMTIEEEENIQKQEKEQEKLLKCLSYLQSKGCDVKKINVKMNIYNLDEYPSIYESEENKEGSKQKIKTIKWKTVKKTKYILEDKKYNIEIEKEVVVVNNVGICKYGDNCKFGSKCKYGNHIKESLSECEAGNKVFKNATKVVIKKENQKSKMCSSVGLKIKCKFGLKCHYAHNITEFEPITCIFNNKCKNINCTFKHANETKEQFINRL